MLAGSALHADDCADAVPVPTGGPVVRAEASQGSYRLVFELEADTFAVDEPIDGRAWLEVAGGAPVGLWASGSGLVLFELREIGGTRGMGARTDDCRRYEVAGRTEPIAIKKAGGYSTEATGSGAGSGAAAGSEAASDTGAGAGVRAATGAGFRTGTWAGMAAVCGERQLSRMPTCWTQFTVQ